MAGKAVIIMGSEQDLNFSREITKYLKHLNINYEFRVALAHETPEKVLKIIEQFKTEKVIFVTVRPLQRAQRLHRCQHRKTRHRLPTIQRKIRRTDIFSSLRVPSGIKAS